MRVRNRVSGKLASSIMVRPFNVRMLLARIMLPSTSMPRTRRERVVPKLSVTDTKSVSSRSAVIVTSLPFHWKRRRRIVAISLYHPQGKYTTEYSTDYDGDKH